MKEELLLIDGKLQLALLNYLSKQPYEEVFRFISTLQQLPQLEGDILDKVIENFNKK